MRKVITPLVLFLIPPGIFAQTGHSSYAGQEQREVKALSPEDIQMYLQGHGMGMAKAAELNHYPGPRHVLDLAAELTLSQEQLAQTQKIYDQMHSEAVRLGKVIVEKEKKLDSLYATQKIDEPQLRALVGDIAKLQGELRLTHPSAHLEMKEILSPQQAAKYDELRGYGESAPQHQHGNHLHPN